MAFTDPTFIADTLDNVLSVLSAAFTTAGRPVDSRRFPGVPAWDCEGLVAWPALRVANPGTQTDPGRLRAAAWRYALDVNLLLLRCVTAVTASGMPDMATVDTDGDAYATDMWILQRAIAIGIRDGTLVPSACTVGRPQPVVPQLPQQFSAMTTTIEIGLG